MRLVDADRVVATVTAENTRDDDTLDYADGLLDGIEVFAEALRNAPTIDAVPVVRCGKCKYMHRSQLEKWCWNEDSICYAQKVTDSWYCADGERKEDAK